MKRDADYILLLHSWNRLTPLQKKMIVIQAHYYRIEKIIYIISIFLFLSISCLVTPVPVRLILRPKAHWLKPQRHT